MIDDDADDRLLFGLSLRDIAARTDITTDYASTALDAQRSLAAGDYDVIVIDHRLGHGGPSGFDLLRDLRAQGVETPAILLTAAGGEQFAAEVMKVRATDYLPKSHLTAGTLDRALRYCRAIAERDRVARDAEARLRRSEERFRALVENSSDGVALIGADGLVQYVSRSIERVLGYTVEEFTGTSIFALMHPDDVSRVTALFGELLQSPRTLITSQMRVRHKDGTYRDIEATGENRFDEGAVAAVVANFRDITERKRLEQQLIQSQKMETVGRLAGGIAHDFNNLLTGILGYCHLLLDQTASDPARRDILEIRQAGERAAALTRQLLAFSRKQVLKPRVIDLNAVVQGMEGMLARVLGEDVELSVILPAPDGSVHVDPVQLEQVILNLAVNARDAMPDGGILTIETSRVLVDRDFAAHHPTMTIGPHAVLRVTDTGVGMAPDVQGHLFEPFFTTKGRGKGSGLGLAMVYGIVKQSGGSIWVSSEPDRGTTFRIYLPITNEPAASGGTSELAAEGGHETVLLVEDESTVRGLARRVLESQGYRVLEASNGRDAFALAAGYADVIDLLLTDVVMPGMSGRELVSELQPLRPKMKVLYMSGYTDNTVERHGLLAPGVTFFPKPFTPAALATVVRQTLDTATV